MKIHHRSLACLFSTIAFAAPTEGQVCSSSIGFAQFIPDTTVSLEESANCSGFRCYEAMLEDPVLTVSPPGCNANAGTCSVTANVRAEFPGNAQNFAPGPPPDPPDSLVKLIWERGDGVFAASCGSFLGKIFDDAGNATFSISLQCSDLRANPDALTFRMRAETCNSAAFPGSCREVVSVTADFAGVLFCEPPRDDCDSCGACPIGGAGPPGCSGGPGAPGKCSSGGGGDDVSAGMSVAGDGIGISIGNSGPGAFMRYRARGPGDAGHGLGLLGLGRYWSHDAAERIISLDPVADRTIELITRIGTFHQFRDEDADDVYEIARPSDDYRRVEKTATGWEIRFLDGTIQRHDSLGHWTETVDPNGNTTTATYNVSNELETVSFPDGRSETFAFGVGGNLASITEVGVGGAATRTWSYTWTGQDLTRIDRPDGLAWEMFYQDAGLPGYLTRVELVGSDGVSRRIVRAWRYDENGSALATWRGALLETDPGAVDVWLMSYDNPRFPRVTTVTDPLGDVATYTFGRDSASTKPRITKIEGDCPTCGLGPNSQLFYDDPANPLRPTRTIDGRGTTTLLTYDVNGQLTSRVEAMGEIIERETTWQYDPTFPALVTEVSQPSTTGNINDFRITMTTYNATGDAELRTTSGFEDGLPFNLTTMTTFTAEGLPDTVDPPGFGLTDLTDFAYDDATRGNVIVTSRTDSIVGTTTFGYDPFNRRSAVTDPNAVTSDTEYDALDRVTRVIQRGPDDGVETDDLITEHRYTVFGDLFQTVLPEGNVIEYGYDHVGRLESIERKADDLPTTHGERSVFTLDDFGHRIREELQRWDAIGSMWETKSATDQVYATRCFLDETIEGAGSASESTTEFAYDCEGNLESIWDANHPSAGQVNPPSTVYQYDELNRLIEIRQPFGGAGTNAVTGYSYDVQDHLNQVTDAEGTVTSYQYSDRDLLTDETSEVSGQKTFVYNEHGELTSETDARLITTARTVDALDRVTFADYPDDTLDIAYTYDDPLVPFAIGRLTAIGRNGTSVDYRYDRFGRLTQDGALAFVYDKNGNRSSISYPSGVSTSTTYDFADRPATLDATLPGLGATSIVTATSYLPSGPVDSLSLGNGIVETRLHDQRYHPDRIMAGALLDWDYTTDGVGNITTIADVLVHANDRTYSYLDHQYFLTQGNGPWGNLSWTYDTIGNRLSETRGMTTDTYAYVPNVAGGNSPTLMSIALGGGGTDAFMFDAAGNQTQIASPTSTLDSGFDDASRQASTGNSIFTVANRYDGRGFLERSERTYPGALFVDGFESGDFACWSDVDGGPVGGTCPAGPPFVAPTYSSNGLLHYLLRGFGDDQRWVLYHAGRPVALVKEVGGGGAQLTFLTTDQLGTPILAMDDVGGEVWEGGFEPFGADFSGAGGSDVFLRFPGQWMDGLWGGLEQEYNVHRWYQSGTGRYGRVDPLSPVNIATFSGSAFEAELEQPFGYGGMNPLLLIDPLGLFTLGPTANPPSPGLGKFLACLEACIGKSFVVTSTTDGKHIEPDHAAGTAGDVRPMGVPSKKVFCCAAKCKAGRCLDERFSPGGAQSNGPHYHFQLNPPNRSKFKNDCEPCKVKGNC